LTAALDAGTEPNANDRHGLTLLMEAVYRNRLDMVNVLLSRGANVHLKDHLYGRTALHWATNRWCSEVFPAVFSAAGPRAMNLPSCNGCTPLHWLARKGSAEQMAFALSHPGIDVSIRNNYGHTPLNVSIDYRSALQTYGDKEARWQPMRSTWIKLLMALALR
jgi:ankyrin repeat protein